MIAIHTIMNVRARQARASPCEGRRKVKAPLAARGIRVGKRPGAPPDALSTGLRAPVRRRHLRRDRAFSSHIPDREAGRALRHGRVAVLQQGGGLVVVPGGRQRLRVGRRRLARSDDGRPLRDAGVGPLRGQDPL